MDELARPRIHPATVELASSWIHPATEELPPGSIRQLPWTTGADYEHRREEEEDTGKNIRKYSFYGSVIRGLHLRPFVPARKAVFSQTANVFCGSAGCGVLASDQHARHLFHPTRVSATELDGRVAVGRTVFATCVRRDSGGVDLDAVTPRPATWIVAVSGRLSRTSGSPCGATSVRPPGRASLCASPPVPSLLLGCSVPPFFSWGGEGGFLAPKPSRSLLENIPKGGFP